MILTKQVLKNKSKTVKHLFTYLTLKGIVTQRHRSKVARARIQADTRTAHRRGWPAVRYTTSNGRNGSSSLPRWNQGFQQIDNHAWQVTIPRSATDRPVQVTVMASPNPCLVKTTILTIFATIPKRLII